MTELLEALEPNPAVATVGFCGRVVSLCGGQVDPIADIQPYPHLFPVILWFLRCDGGVGQP
jgi:hypothetical protein